MLPGTNLSRSIARSGMDWICVDTEHGNISDDNMHECVAAIAACGVSPVVRVAEGQHVRQPTPHTYSQLSSYVTSG